MDPTHPEVCKGVLSCLLNRIPAMAPYTATPFWGPYFKGTYLPQNRVHSPHLEGERYSL